MTRRSQKEHGRKTGAEGEARPRCDGWAAEIIWFSQSPRWKENYTQLTGYYSQLEKTCWRATGKERLTIGICSRVALLSLPQKLQGGIVKTEYAGSLCKYTWAFVPSGAVPHSGLIWFQIDGCLKTFQKSKEAHTVNPEGGVWEAKRQTHWESMHHNLLLWGWSVSRDQYHSNTVSFLIIEPFHHILSRREARWILRVGTGLIEATTAGVVMMHPCIWGNRSSYLYLHCETKLPPLASLLQKGGILGQTMHEKGQQRVEPLPDHTTAPVGSWPMLNLTEDSQLAFDFALLYLEVFLHSQKNSQATGEAKLQSTWTYLQWGVHSFPDEEAANTHVLLFLKLWLVGLWVVTGVSVSVSATFTFKQAFRAKSSLSNTPEMCFSLCCILGCFSFFQNAINMVVC